LAPAGRLLASTTGRAFADLSRAIARQGGGSQRLLAITAIGRLDPKAGAIRRADGRPGDLLVSTGCHGLSRLGLALLQRESITLTTDQPSPTADSTLGSRAIQAHRRPVPRFDAVVALMDSRPEGTPWRVGGCDSSDGLAAAVTAIAQASGCQAHLIKEALPIDPAMTPLSQAVPWCLEGGEDFELVLALDPGWARSLCTVCAGATVIGTLEKGSAGRLCWSNGVPIFPGRPGTPGFRHFS